ncbi:hypothetical protein [Enterovibrio norvegicus]|uniref:RiboL-PSP-HEPN domain-containing protein n=1 Tax=Enterovibrio norvegicus TaxID=188144 RepID=A0A2N7L953_9GAMM|nr:hypothetical protein [Enterovibrio norvegicus]PMN90827.1 hypothetical protein BCT23_19100 [Enterovibrio norvegicus]
MDIQSFALSRVEFILGFYEKALSPFVETKYLIEQQKQPFQAEYEESDEPPFLSEWLNADQAIDVLGMQCASLLCSTLKLFLEESLKNVFRRNARKITKTIKTEQAYSACFKNGWLNGYKDLFEKEFNLNWQTSGVNLTILEELVLIRNRGQHPEHISMMSNNFSKNDLKKISSPFFIDEIHGNNDMYDFLSPKIKPKPEKMKTAFEESIKLINWLEFSLEKWGMSQLNK